MQEELKRTRRTFAFFEHTWNAASALHSKKPGHAAYTLERAAMYAAMADECAAAQVSAGCAVETEGSPIDADNIARGLCSDEDSEYDDDDDDDDDGVL